MSDARSDVKLLQHGAVSGQGHALKNQAGEQIKLRTGLANLLTYYSIAYAIEH
jgi:hypothetical protein